LANTPDIINKSWSSQVVSLKELSFRIFDPAVVTRGFYIALKHIPEMRNNSLVSEMVHPYTKNPRLTISFSFLHTISFSSPHTISPWLKSHVELMSPFSRMSMSNQKQGCPLWDLRYVF